MRKNINKLIAVAIGISVISGSIIPAFAADAAQQTTSTSTTVQIVNGKPLLTLDDAIKAAISNSDTLKLDEQKISYQDKINDLTEKQDDVSTSVADDKKDLDKDTGDTTLKQAKQQMDFDQDILTQNTTKAYNNIVTSQMKIDKATKDIAVKTKQLNDAKLKQSLGITTTIDLQTTELQVENLQNALKSSENALNDAEYSFKVLTGKDVTQYSLEQDIKYESFKIDGSIDEYLDNVIDTDLKYSEQLLKLTKDYLHDNEVKEPTDTDKAPNPGIFTFSQDEDLATYLSDYKNYEAKLEAYQEYTGKLSARLAYLNSKLSIYEKQNSLDEGKKQLKENLRTLYTNLLTTEDNINYIKQNIELTNKQLSNAKLKYDLGLMTKSDYDTLVVNSEDLEIQLRSAIDTHNTLESEIQKPWLLSGGNSSSSSGNAGA